MLLKNVSESPFAINPLNFAYYDSSNLTFSLSSIPIVPLPKRQFLHTRQIDCRLTKLFPVKRKSIEVCWFLVLQFECDYC